MIIRYTDAHRAGEIFCALDCGKRPCIGREMSSSVHFLVLTRHMFETYVICGCASLFAISSNLKRYRLISTRRSLAAIFRHAFAVVAHRVHFTNIARSLGWGESRVGPQETRTEGLIISFSISFISNLTLWLSLVPSRIEDEAVYLPSKIRSCSIKDWPFGSLMCDPTSSLYQLQSSHTPHTHPPMAIGFPQNSSPLKWA